MNSRDFYVRPSDGAAFDREQCIRVMVGYDHANTTIVVTFPGRTLRVSLVTDDPEIMIAAREAVKFMEPRGNPLAARWLQVLIGRDLPGLLGGAVYDALTFVDNPPEPDPVEPVAD